MLDPSWTPERGYSHAAALMSIGPPSEKSLGLAQARQEPTVDDGDGIVYDQHMNNQHTEGNHMRDEVTVHIVRPDTDWEFPASDEFKEQLMREMEFGVNLPDDQEYELVACVIMRHHA